MTVIIKENLQFQLTSQFLQPQMLKIKSSIPKRYLIYISILHIIKFDNKYTINNKLENISRFCLKIIAKYIDKIGIFRFYL